MILKALNMSKMPKVCTKKRKGLKIQTVPNVPRVPKVPKVLKSYSPALNKLGNAVMPKVLLKVPKLKTYGFY